MLKNFCENVANPLYKPGGRGISYVGETASGSATDALEASPRKSLQRLLRGKPRSPERFGKPWRLVQVTGEGTNVSRQAMGMPAQRETGGAGRDGNAPSRKGLVRRLGSVSHGPAGNVLPARRSAAALLLVCFLALSSAAFAETPRAVLVPLDDRPSTLLFPVQIARIGGGSLAVPPRGWLGNWHRPGDSDKVAKWLLSQNVDRAIVSSDMLCYGGLVASRTAAVPQEKALARLDTLRALKDLGASTEVLATIPRLDLRTSDRQAPYARALQIWAERENASPPPDVPADVVEEYLGVRRRNNAVLHALVGMVAEGVIGRLVVGQDDSSPRGLNMAEQVALRAEIARRGVNDRVLMLSGADELAVNMVTGWLCEKAGWGPRVRIAYSDNEAAERVPSMESLPLDQTVNDHLRLAGAHRVGIDEDADVVLFIATPPLEPLELKALKARATEMAGRVMALLDSGAAVGLADLEHLNRADPELAFALIGEIPIWRMDAYAGWNTSSNAMGTAVAQCIAHRLAVEGGWDWPAERILESEKTHQAFLLARLADDYWYQAVLRARMAAEAAALPTDPDPLLNLFGPIGLQIRLDMIAWADQLFTRHFKGQTVFVPPLGKAVRLDRLEMEVVLPWQRIFEIEVRANLTVVPE